MTETITRSFGDTSYPLYIARPAASARGTLILIHEVWGLTDHIRSVADRFADEGYVVLAPDLLADTGITSELIGDLQEELFDPERRSTAQPKLRALMAPLQAPGFAETTLNKLADCFAYAQTLPETTGRIGIVGFCFGGSYSYSFAEREPQLAFAVPFYGHANARADALRAITCPVLAFYGEQDEILMAELPALEQAMAEARVDFTAQVYGGCGHAFFNDTNRFSYNQAAADDAWQRTLAFIAAHSAD
ncbi:MAG TPA: dienelactone hydrolase family protein [Candidatus Saccharimonadales bacterium]|nr:dienelactone hydrolase family protein [Candidatus Saccharimonadales bacterium]